MNKSYQTIQMLKKRRSIPLVQRNTLVIDLDTIFPGTGSFTQQTYQLI